MKKKSKNTNEDELFDPMPRYRYRDEKGRFCKGGRIEPYETRNQALYDLYVKLGRPVKLIK